MELTGKTELRAQMRPLVRAIQAEERRQGAEQFRSQLITTKIWKDAAKVLLFVPLPDEPDISSLLDAAWLAGKTVALPQTDPSTGNYLAAVVQGRAELASGRFGVLEPVAGCPILPLNQLDLVLVPGVAFDTLGGRLGRGKGFYDRLLAQVPGHKCGVAFDIQIVPSVQVESHDVRVDSILTPSRWQLCRPA